MSAHAILGPSSASRWLACTPSARFEEQYPDSESIYAQEGTIAHEVAALILAVRAGAFKGDHNPTLSRIKFQADLFYERQGKPSEWQSMYDHAEDYAKFIIEQAPGDIHIERRYSLTDYVPLGFGTGDATNVMPKVLYVTDYKYGAGIRVSATANKQMMLYGLGALKEVGTPSIETVVLNIFQPRAGGSSTWQISVAELIKWAEDEVKPKRVDEVKLDTVAGSTYDLMVIEGGRPKRAPFAFDVAEPFKNKIITILGDSNVVDYGAYFANSLKAKLKATEVYRRGTGGQSFASGLQDTAVINSMVADNPDLLILFSVNDPRINSAIGNLSDVPGAATMVGGLKKIINASITNKKNTKIIIITPFPYGGVTGGYENVKSDNANTLGLFASDYITKQIEIARMFGVKVADVSLNSNIHPQVESTAEREYTIDGVHLNNKGWDELLKTVLPLIKAM